MLDMIIKNAVVVDPANNINRRDTVGIKEGKIVDMGLCGSEDAEEVVDASGCFVTPGIIDFHAHIYTDGTERGIYPDSTCFPMGVTTCVDGGSAGVANYELFRNSVIPMSKVRILSYLNVCSLGLGTVTYPENVDPKAFNIPKIKRFCEKYRDDILGLKLRQSKEIAKEYGLEPLKEMVRIAGEINTYVVVHVTNSPGEVRETLDLLRPGDIFCHVYHGKGRTIIGEDGRVLKEVWEARKRGILFDAAHGGNQFSNKTALHALSEGFLPDFITSDISMKTMYRPPLFSMGNVMSKFLNMGIDFYRLIQIVTENPARKMGRLREIGTLSPGSCADVAIFRIVEKETKFDDSHGEKMTGDRLIKTEMTIREGVPVFRQIDF